MSMEVMNPPVYAHAPKATAGARIGAYLIDVLVIIGISLIPILGWVVGPIYLLTRDALPFLDGQSLGKRAVGLRAVDENGASLKGNWGPSVVRNVVLFIPFFPLIELIVLLTNADTRRLGDQWGKTRVVSAK
jgi:uncharacterized RDD family membrane protein YckC